MSHPQRPWLPGWRQHGARCADTPMWRGLLRPRGSAVRARCAPSLCTAAGLPPLPPYLRKAQAVRAKLEEATTQGTKSIDQVSGFVLFCWVRLV